MKPIGELGCCESGMAERSHWWTERCLRSPLFLSLSLTISYLPIYLLCIYLSIDLSIYLSLSLSLFHLITSPLPNCLESWGGGIPGNSTETFHRKMMTSQYFTIFTTAGYEAWKQYVYIYIYVYTLTLVFPNSIPKWPSRCVLSRPCLGF